MSFLEFEQPIVELEEKIAKLRGLLDENPHLHEEFCALQDKLKRLSLQIYKNLSAWQRTQLARHPKRPSFSDYINLIFDDFIELHGDRICGDDWAIRCGIAKISCFRVVVVGHDKGSDVRSRMRANFGMAHPQGYRKALRVMQLAEKFHKPVVVFVDTPGAYPGVSAEAGGQGIAIAKNLFELSCLRCPIIVTIIGEGGSGGALGIGVGDYVMMLEYSIFSVISPEGAAAILWRSQDKVEKAAESLALTPQRLLELGIIDEIIAEPIGGAHRDKEKAAENIKMAILRQLERLTNVDTDELVRLRRQRLRNIGEFST